MLVFVCLIYKQGINAHVIEILHIISPAVKHFLCPDFCILQCHSFFLLVIRSTLLGGFIGKSCKLFLQLFNFPFSLPGNHAFAVWIGFFHLFKDNHLLLYLVLNKSHLAFLAVWNELKGRLRDNNHVPIIVAYFGIEILSSLCATV